MKKYFKNFAIIWLIGVIMFSVFAFVAAMLIPGKKIDATFIICYVAVLAAFLIQLGLGYKCLNEENKDRVFLHMPLLSLGKSCVIVTALVCTALAFIPGVPFPVAILAAVLILGFFAIAVVKADTAATAVQDIGQKAAVNTAFVRQMTTAAEGLIARARTDEGKATANKVFEAMRYANKSSTAQLGDVEAKIQSSLSVLTDAVTAGDDELTRSVGEQLLRLIAERESLAKSAK